MASNVPALLENGKLAGTPVPSFCSLGESPDFLDTATGVLYTCGTGNTYIPLTGGAGTGTVTHTSGALTANLPVLGNGGADVKVGAAAQLVPTLPADATQFLNGTGAFSVPTGLGGTVTHTGGALTANLPVLGNGGADTKPGLAAQLVPTLPGVATQFLNGTGAFSVPTTVTTQAQPVRALGVVYQNTTAKPVFVSIVILGSSSTGALAKTDSSNPPTTPVGTVANADATPVNMMMTFIVLPGNFYTVTGAGTITLWTEWN
jgi:hypothetical protein